MKKNLFILTAAFLMVATVPSCNLYPDSETRVEDLDITITHYDKANDFSQNHTYSIVDDVVEIDDDTTHNPDVITNSDLIIQQIDANMQALGYEKAGTASVPDVTITALATSTTTWYYYYYYYWDYWYGWGWGYPCCYYYPPTYPVVESYTTGTLVMQMVQFQGIASGDSARAVWTGVVNGLLEEDTPANLKTRIKNSVDEAFKQSPYLDVNP